MNIDRNISDSNGGLNAGFSAQDMHDYAIKCGMINADDVQGKMRQKERKEL